MRPARSILCIPGHRADWIEKARANDLYGADQILLDLEDSVPAARKEEAREVVSAALAVTVEMTAVRINAASSDFFDRDMEMLELSPVEIWVPKCESLTPIFQVHECRYGDARGPLVAGIESATGVLRAAPEILTYSSLPAGLYFGRHDFIASAGLSPWQTAAIDHAAAQVALAAAARGVPCWMAPSDEIDPGRLEVEARLAHCFGFTGMGCIAPWQVPHVNAEFDVFGYDRYRATRLLAAAEANLTEAVFRTEEGDLVSPPTVAWARRVMG